MTYEEEQFEQWFARNHPWDWFKEELGKPLPSMARLCIWELCRDAYLHREGQRRERLASKATGDT